VDVRKEGRKEGRKEVVGEGHIEVLGFEIIGSVWLQVSPTSIEKSQKRSKPKPPNYI
jgi:hypothetical protein